MNNGNTGPATHHPANHDEHPHDVSHGLQATIGRALQTHYLELVREPIPDRLLDLLAALEAGTLSHE
jgi:hypothetical protein